MEGRIEEDEELKYENGARRGRAELKRIERMTGGEEEE